MTAMTTTTTKFAVQRQHRDATTGEFGEPMFLRRLGAKQPNYRARNPFKVMHDVWAHRAQDALTWANRETAEAHAERLQAAADRNDEGHYRSKVGDTVVTVVEVAS